MRVKQAMVWVHFLPWSLLEKKMVNTRQKWQPQIMLSVLVQVEYIYFDEFQVFRRRRYENLLRPEAFKGLGVKSLAAGRFFKKEWYLTPLECNCARFQSNLKYSTGEL